jgi:hypothetical protein
MPCGNRPHALARLLRLSNDPLLLFHAPAPPPFAGADNLDLTVRQRFKVDLKVGFKVNSFAISQWVKARRGSPDVNGWSEWPS